MKKVSNEVANAAMVQALLAGDSIDSAISEAAAIQELLASEGIPETVNYEEDEIEIDIDLDGHNKKKRKTSKPKNNTEEPVVKHVLLEKCTFADINKSVELIVRFGDHDIHYKDQLWPIHDRDVVYQLERIDIPKEAMNAAETIYGKNVSHEIKDKARNGELRYLKVISYENIPSYSRCLGYIEVAPNKKVRKWFNKDSIKKSHADKDKVIASVNKALKELVKYI